MRILLLLIAFAFIGCVTEPEVDPKTPEGLYKLGRFYQEQDRFEEAINQYKALSNKHPYSKLATEAELRVADCYYEREDFAEAFNAYKLFKELHPKSPQMDYVAYRAAESLNEQLPSTVDRDLTKAKEAISFYQEVFNVYPDSKLAKEAREKQNKLIQMLADKEIYIADFYFKQEKYLSSLTRYELFLKEFPQNKRVPYALLRAATAAKKLEISDKTTLYKGLLLQQHPDSSEAKKAKRSL